MNKHVHINLVFQFLDESDLIVYKFPEYCSHHGRNNVPTFFSSVEEVRVKDLVPCHKKMSDIVAPWAYSGRCRIHPSFKLLTVAD